MGSANERRRYNVTSSLIGWAHSQNYPCTCSMHTVICLPLDIHRMLCLHMSNWLWHNIHNTICCLMTIWLIQPVHQYFHRAYDQFCITKWEVSIFREPSQFSRWLPRAGDGVSLQGMTIYYPPGGEMGWKASRGVQTIMLCSRGGWLTIENAQAHV